VKTVFVNIIANIVPVNCAILDITVAANAAEKINTEEKITHKEKRVI